MIEKLEGYRAAAHKFANEFSFPLYEETVLEEFKKTLDSYFEKDQLLLEFN